MAVVHVRSRARLPGAVSLTFADHFSRIADRYAEYRPRYPHALAEALAARCANRDIAWDAGCGNGQLSITLAAHFDDVIASDPSQAQLDAAERHPKVDYRCAKAEQSGIGDASIDLAVAAQAAHWFDWPRYVAEVGRVTKPGGLVALISYGIMYTEEDASEILAQYYRKDAGPYWPPERVHVENGYAQLKWPWPEVEAPAIDMTAQWTRDELIGYVATWSATQKLVESQGLAPFQRLQDRLAEVWPKNEKRTVRWPLAIRLARR